jgi:purine-binding chemotaxis protein CheW
VTQSVLAADSASADPNAADGGIEAVLVRLGASRFAADLSCVAEVGRVPGITRIPGAPVWLAGIVNWRGRLLPVLDLRTLLGAESGSLGEDARVVVLSTDGVSAGMLVDAVEGTGALGAVEEFPAAMTGPGIELLAGQVPRLDGPVAVLDVAAVLRMRDRLPRGRRSA